MWPFDRAKIIAGGPGVVANGLRIDVNRGLSLRADSESSFSAERLRASHGVGRGIVPPIRLDLQSAFVDQNRFHRAVLVA